MITRDSAVFWTAVTCAVVAFSVDVGKQLALDSLAHTCRPQAGEVLVSVHQAPTGLTCIFAPAEFVGYRAKRFRKAT